MSNPIEVTWALIHTVKKGSYLLMVSLLVLSACSVGRPADDATGDEIYRQLCVRCHGADLKGGIGPPLGPRSNAATQPDAFLEFTIVYGRGAMPSFSSSLNDQQVDRLVAYIREEQER